MKFCTTLASGQLPKSMVGFPVRKVRGSSLRGSPRTTPLRDPEAKITTAKIIMARFPFALVSGRKLNWSDLSDRKCCSQLQWRLVVRRQFAHVWDLLDITHKTLTSLQTILHSWMDMLTLLPNWHDIRRFFYAILCVQPQKKLDDLRFASYSITYLLIIVDDIREGWECNFERWKMLLHVYSRLTLRFGQSVHGSTVAVVDSLNHRQVWFFGISSTLVALRRRVGSGCRDGKRIRVGGSDHWMRKLVWRWSFLQSKKCPWIFMQRVVLRSAFRGFRQITLPCRLTTPSCPPQ